MKRISFLRASAPIGFCPSVSVNRLFAGGLLAAALGASVAPAAHAGDLSKIAPDLAASLRPAAVGTGKAKFDAFRVAKKASDATNEPRFRVLVRLNTSVKNEMTTNSVRAKVGVLGRTFASSNIAVVEATPAQILALSNDPNVASLSPDRAVASSADLDVNRTTTGVDVAGQAITSTVKRDGRGINIAVLDSGVAPVADLAPSILGFKDFINNQTAPYDDYGHGTHVAGIIAGNGSASSASGATTTYKGIATGSKIIGVKVLQSDGSGSTSDIIAGIDWCIANKAAYKIRVINLSLTGGVWESYTTDPLCQAAERAVNAGIVVVAAAGNIGGVYGAVGTPANDPAVIAVGASNSRNTVGRGDDVITSYSSRGPSRFDLCIKPDVIAPGNQIVSVRAPGSTIDSAHPETQVPTTEYTTSGGTTAYTRLSGTSMAAPMVAGAAALVLQTNAALQPNGVKAALMYSAELLTGYDPILQTTGVYDPLTQGAGEINIPGAVEMANIMRPSGLRVNPSLSSTIGGASVSWLGATLPSLLNRPGGVSADNLIWGGHIDPVQPTNNAVWASNLVWGGRLFNDNLVWGANLIWGGHIDPQNNALALDAPDTADLVWANQAFWGKAELSSGTTQDGMVNASNLIWGGHIDPQNNYNPSAANLIWGGHIDPAQLYWGKGNLSSGDDPVEPYPAP